ncbi:MAG: tRNA uridine-5-carboxymethylaminomethyl(34) synthesis GTPase MnmE [Betaproteobacteria bacterium]|nr:tRNA uridine-5-carboxymethylaminomethyl(34) synthesis GTPase MnmE [Betaproteobacteria bacterium]NDC02230.1 tRNA uridine-5-carboxymethylaminomethyl(34) synthesis GTPase MnmE [Betaproteobacteria bacterium]NDC85175.1 tRNA uridine-5-carboxymethylaminomethyl(34) synthesis GTPase MnmE [Betaproteobacteria bacterium]NDG80902.1 tRNA uridine-5-carboxymethylaminomethyl(34) synthesis GTPase MnmE [Betaproteobacteria bacterium]
MMNLVSKTPKTEPILAQATAKGLSAIAVLRISGSDLAGTLLPRLGWALEPRRASLRTLRAGNGEAIDQVLAVFFPAPHSFTGEDLLELHTHGSPAMIAWALETMLDYGKAESMRLAKPGEFSERAFLNGRIDLAQAEAIADLIAASTRLQAKAALASLQGDFSKQVHRYLDAVQHMRLLVEAALDFPEEPVESLSDWGLENALTEAIAAMQGQLPAWQRGAQLQQGLSLALIGPPNAGKSSLLNAFAGEELALVDAEPGTTRDRISQRFQWAGQAIEMTDTAGIRDAAQAGRIELRGMQRSWESALRAQAVLLVISLEDIAPTDDRGDLLQRAQHHAKTWWQANRPSDDDPSMAVPTLVVLNKIDLLGADPAADDLLSDAISGGATQMSAASWPVVAVSAKEARGLETLMDAVLNKLAFQGESTEPLWARLRHVQALERALGHLKLAQAHWTTSQGQADLMAEELRLAQQALAEMIGVWSDEDLLGAIFGRFCIGK